jgi:hypothetical protein
MDDVLGTLRDLAPIIAAAAAVVAATVGFINRRKVNQIEVKVDGRMEELLGLTEKLARAQGITQGEQDQRDRTTGGEK